MVRDAGHQFTGAEDGLVASHLLSEHQYDVVITDLRMPRLDGWGVLRQVRKTSPRTVTLLMTAYPTGPDEESADVRGADEYLEKPIEGPELTSHLRRIVERRDATGTS
jgi:two-component system response regulator PilR (NtrC family)